MRLWVDLIEINEKERQAVETELKQLLVTPSELSDIEASARFFEDEDDLHIHSFFIIKITMNILVIRRLLSLFVMAVYIHYGIVICRIFVYIVYVQEVKS